MKKLLILIIFLGIASTLFSQVKLNYSLTPNDSVLISYRHFTAATQAFIQLRNLKKQTGITQEQLHQKDVAIQFYERGYKKYMASDSINTILLKNKDLEINTLSNSLSESKRERRLFKNKTIGLAISLPAAIILSFLAGFYIAK